MIGLGSGFEDKPPLRGQGLKPDYGCASRRENQKQGDAHGLQKSWLFEALAPLTDRNWSVQSNCGGEVWGGERESAGDGCQLKGKSMRRNVMESKKRRKGRLLSRLASFGNRESSNGQGRKK